MTYPIEKLLCSWQKVIAHFASDVLFGADEEVLKHPRLKAAASS
jgi:hypothetical protein